MDQHDELIDDERNIKKVLLFCLPFLVLAIVIPVCAYFSIWIPDEESEKVWFQRSGSFTVLFAVLVEYKLSKITSLVNLNGVVISPQKERSNKYRGVFNIVAYLAAALAILGTLIWGYGDIYYEANNITKVST